MKNIVNQIGIYTLDVIYPNYCLHCSEKIEQKCFYFCKNCIERLIFSSFKFQNCTIGVFEKTDVFFTFLNEIKKQKQRGIIKVAAAFMIIKYLRLNLSMPDVIVPTKQSFFFKDHCFLIAKEIAKILKRPICLKAKKEKRILQVFDVISLKSMKNRGENITKIGLCFDVFFDHFNLSK